MATRLLLGNTQVIEVLVIEDPQTHEPIDEQRVSRSDLGNQVTYVEFPDDLDGQTDEQLVHLRALWSAHSDAPPAWIESPDDSMLATVAAAVFSTPDAPCPVGRPDGWQEGPA